MGTKKHPGITCIPEISAIYFALLQCGYDYYAMERSREHNDRIQRFIDFGNIPSFFTGVRQDTCEVYPYWPRAAILETASFYLSDDCSAFKNYDALREDIMSAGNIANYERDQKLWDWLEGFPSAISKVLSDSTFKSYLQWEKQWLSELNTQYEAQLQLVQSCLDICTSEYGSHVRDIQIVINPVKCVYSADYHFLDNRFIFSSGTFKAESVIHEFLHHVVHPAIGEIVPFVLAGKRIYPGIDNSYYLTHTDAGYLNAFEEYAVRELAKNIMDARYPDTLDTFLKELI